MDSAVASHGRGGKVCMICLCCDHQKLPSTSSSFLSPMTSSLKLKSMIHADVMNIHDKFLQLRDNRKHSVFGLRRSTEWFMGKIDIDANSS